MKKKEQGSKKHSDEKEDLKMLKKMIKPSALKGMKKQKNKK